MFKLFMIYFYIIYVFYNGMATPPKDYGKFNLRIRDLKICKGPKRQNCTILSPKPYNSSNWIYHIQVLERTMPDKGKVIIMKDGSHLMRLQMKKPCDHLYLGPLLKQLLLTNSCVFQKGNYSLNLNINELVHGYYGGMFIYGNVTFKTIIYSDLCNFICNISEMEFVPKL